jgi:glutamyl-tRNA reductase
LQPSLIVIGLSYPGSPVTVRERFWMDSARRFEALIQLGARDGIEELALLVNTERTEFIIWAGDISAAAASVLEHLTHEHGLSLGEWKNFYRLVDDTAVSHLLRLASGLESRFGAGIEIMDEIGSALAQARKAGTAGPHLEMLLDQLLQAANRVRQETGIQFQSNLALCAAMDVAGQELGNLSDKRVLVISDSRRDELRGEARHCPELIVVSHLRRRHASENNTGAAESFDDVWQGLVQADVVINYLSGPCSILRRDDARSLAARRNGAPLYVFDLAVPRGVDPATVADAGFFLYNIDDLRRTWEDGGDAGNAAAEALIARESKLLVSKLNSSSLSATIVGYNRIKELCHEVAQTYSQELAASDEQAQALEAMSARIATRISNYLNAEFMQGDKKRANLMSAVRRLFHDGQRGEGARPDN